MRRQLLTGDATRDEEKEQAQTRAKIRFYEVSHTRIPPC